MSISWASLPAWGVTNAQYLLPAGIDRWLTIGDNDVSQGVTSYSGGTLSTSVLADMTLSVGVNIAYRIPLHDGRILIGGKQAAYPYTHRAFLCTVLSSSSVSWVEATVSAPAMDLSVVSTSPSTILADGRFLTVQFGGGTTANTFIGSVSGDAVTWVASTNLITSFVCWAASILPDGRIMIIGDKVPTPFNPAIVFGTVSGTSITWVEGTISGWPYSGHRIQEMRSLAMSSGGWTMTMGGYYAGPVFYYSVNKLTVSGTVGTFVNWGTAPAYLYGGPFGETSAGELIHRDYLGTLSGYVPVSPSSFAIFGSSAAYFASPQPYSPAVLTVYGTAAANFYSAVFQGGALSVHGAATPGLKGAFYTPSTMHSRGESQFNPTPDDLGPHFTSPGRADIVFKSAGNNAGKMTGVGSAQAVFNTASRTGSRFSMSSSASVILMPANIRAGAFSANGASQIIFATARIHPGNFDFKTTSLADFAGRKISPSFFITAGRSIPRLRSPDEEAPETVFVFSARPNITVLTTND